MTTNHRITTTALLIVSVAAAGAPAASAMPIGGDPATAVNPTPTVYSPQDKSLVPGTSPSTSGGAVAKVSASQPVVRIQTPNGGFDWGDAGIGAAGGLALAMVGLGGGLVLSQRRTRRASQTTALPS